MRILHIIDTLNTGGAESLVAQIVPRMISNGCYVEVAVFVSGDTPFYRSLVNSGVKVHSFSKSGSVYNPLNILRLRKLMADFDIIHTHNTAPQLFAALASIGEKTTLFTTEHGGSNRRRTWKWYVPFDRWMYNKYKRIICISAKAEDALRKHIKSDADSILTINNGIEVHRFADAQRMSQISDSVPSSAVTITMVAGFRWEKDQMTLIKAMKLLPDNFYLILVGDGVLKEECQSLASAEGVANRVIFLGIRTDIPEILKTSDFVAMSSHFEGLSLSSLEGMAAGKPLLASDVDGLREVVKDAGILFPNGDSEEFAKQVMRLYSDKMLYSEVASRCATRATEYDISNMVRGYMQLYHTI